MNVGFDPGAHELRVVWRRGSKLIARYCRSAYSVLPDDAGQREVVTRSRLPFARCDGHLVLLGDSIASFDSGVRGPTWPLLYSGLVTQADPLAREILSAELETLLPPSPTAESLCGISLPVARMDQQDDRLSSTREFLMQRIKLRGYTPLEISPARALILAELSDTGFTGLAVTFGSACCAYSLCLGGEELVAGYVARGGQWLDQQFAEQQPRFRRSRQGMHWIDSEAVAAWKVAERPLLLTPRNSEEALLRDLYCGLLKDVFQQVFDALFEAKLPRPFPRTTLLIGGGLSRIAGFQELIEQLWLRPGLPLEIDDIRLADDSSFTIARGCLIHAALVSTPASAVA